MSKKLHTWADIKASRPPRPPEVIIENAAWVERESNKLDLQALRKQLGVTQVQLAAAAGLAQGDVSRIEQREDHMVSTLRRVVRALGAELELHARFPDGRDVRLVTHAPAALDTAARRLGHAKRRPPPGKAKAASGATRSRRKA